MMLPSAELASSIELHHIWVNSSTELHHNVQSQLRYKAYPSSEPSSPSRWEGGAGYEAVQSIPIPEGEKSQPSLHPAVHCPTSMSTHIANNTRRTWPQSTLAKLHGHSSVLLYCNNRLDTSLKNIASHTRDLGPNLLKVRIQSCCIAPTTWTEPSRIPLSPTQDLGPTLLMVTDIDMLSTSSLDHLPIHCLTLTSHPQSTYNPNCACSTKPSF